VTTSEPTRVDTKQVTTINAANYAAGIIGAAALRTMFRDPASAVPRFAELADLVTKDALGLAALAIGIRPTDVAEGYGEWAQFYDQPNPAIAMEEPHVQRIVSELPRNEGVPTGTPGALRLAGTTETPYEPVRAIAVDIACGTGRHAAFLATLGYEVIGTDSTQAMLDVAIPKVPNATFHLAEMEHLPLEDGIADVVTCALAISQLPDPTPAYAEIARILKPGGVAVISDIHPLSQQMGGGAVYGNEGFNFGVVTDYSHPIGRSLASFRNLGLTVEACIEVERTEAELSGFPLFTVYPDAVRAAYLRTPFIIVWHLTKASDTTGDSYFVTGKYDDRRSYGVARR
jgi:SAM-dependent methyltransferase